MKRNIKLKSRILESFGSQRYFAEVAGTTEQRMCRIVTGRSLPKANEKRLWAKKLKSTEEEIEEKQYSSNRKEVSHKSRNNATNISFVSRKPKTRKTFALYSVKILC